MARAYRRAAVRWMRSHPGRVPRHRRRSVIATCERLGQTELATLDRRHFSIVRPRHCAALTLLPRVEERTWRSPAPEHEPSGVSLMSGWTLEGKQVRPRQ